MARETTAIAGSNSEYFTLTIRGILTQNIERVSHNIPHRKEPCTRSSRQENVLYGLTCPGAYADIRTRRHAIVKVVLVSEIVQALSLSAPDQGRRHTCRHVHSQLVRRHWCRSRMNLFLRHSLLPNESEDAFTSNLHMCITYGRR